MPIYRTYQEPFLRMTIGHIYNAETYLGRFIEGVDPIPDELASALHAMDAAKADIRKWAKGRGIKIRDTMKT